MTQSSEDHAERFDRKATEYDSNATPTYEECRDLVIDHARVGSEDVVLDIGTGTGAIALALAAKAKRVVGRDISAGMLERARTKADSQDVDTVSFGEGSFREPNYEGPVDVVTSNFAMHHLDDEAKREAIATIATYQPRQFVLGDLMLFDDPDPSEPYYDPDVDDPATVGVLADAFTDAGFSLTAVERVTDQVGVLVGTSGRPDQTDE